MIKALRSIVILLAPWSAVACSAGTPADGWQDETDYGVESGEQALVRCEVEPLQEGAGVRLSIKNITTEAIDLREGGSPWDAKADAFRVESLDGDRAMFAGLIAIRDPEHAKQLRIAPGEALSVDYPIARKYGLKGGGYFVSVKADALRLTVAGEQVEETPTCNVVTIVANDQGESVGSVQEPLVPFGCNATQASEITHLNAVTRTAAVYSRNLTYNGSPLYDRWFGDWGGGNASDVKDYVSRYIGQEWDLRCNGGDCCDDPGVLGCHAPEIFGDNRLYVCPPWWGMTNTSAVTQSRVSVLMHEHAHLDAAGMDGKEDIRDLGSCGGDCYGYNAALNLAQDPSCTGGASTCKAIRNAENFGFFINDGLMQFAAYSSAL